MVAGHYFNFFLAMQDTAKKKDLYLAVSLSSAVYGILLLT